MTIREVIDADLSEKKGKQNTAERFGLAWTLYQEKGFAEAETMFRERLAVFPQDEAAQIYIERCQQMLKAGFG